MTRIFGGMRRSLILPALLIVAGVLSLAANLGYVDAASARAFVRTFWPVVFVLIGVEMLWGRFASSRDEQPQTVR